MVGAMRESRSVTHGVQFHLNNAGSRPRALLGMDHKRMGMSAHVNELGYFESVDRRSVGTRPSQNLVKLVLQ
jgi:hypothetical protein